MAADSRRALLCDGFRVSVFHDCKTTRFFFDKLSTSTNIIYQWFKKNYYDDCIYNIIVFLKLFK